LVKIAAIPMVTLVIGYYLGHKSND